MIHYRTLDLGKHTVFYREAGNADAPVLLLLHGFPTSSHMFRNLIPILMEHYRIIAPDLPGFGFTKSPQRGEFDYSFDNLAAVMEEFVQALEIARFAMYVFDYGAPVGFRLALRHPDKISAIISQNGNAYEEGLSEGWNPIQAYWREPSDENRAALRDFLSLDTTRWQYTHGVQDESLVAPESYVLDSLLMQRPGNDEIQLDLFLDYATNVRMYPDFQEYFRTQQPPMLAIWGEQDPFFLPPGAEAFKRDNPKAQVQFVDSGHFALETHAKEIAAAIHNFLM
ncbi:MAG: alpha/beta hydrolase [Pseudohongiellaceae bacterium]|nr:alpha/beta hydrolase [Pseudohongiellaceae bacterium]